MKWAAMAYVDVEGGRIYYRVEGKSDAPALVLSNSLGADLSMWEPQMRGLLSNFRVVRYDNRGHGASAVSVSEYTIEKLGNDVSTLLDHLGIARFSFCGLSMGGMVGMWLALRSPARLKKLVLCNTAARIGTRESWNARIEAVRKNGMSEISAAVLQRWFTPSFREREPATVERVQQMLLETPPDGYIASCAAIRDADFRDVVSRLCSQTLVIAGSRDRATPPEEGRFLAERISSAQYVELEAAHLSNIELPQKFEEEVVRFLVA